MHTIQMFFASFIALFMSVFGVVPNEPVTTNFIATSTITEINNKLIDTGYISNYEYKPDPVQVGVVIPDYMVFISPSGVKNKVPETVKNSLLGLAENYEKGPVLSNYIMPVSTLDDEVIYMATAEKLDNGLGLNLRVYSYNLKTLELKEVYKDIRNDTTEATLVGATTTTISRELLFPKVVGIEGDKLIFVNIMRDSSPGPCADLWAYFNRNNYNVYYLDLMETGKGLQKYTISESTLKDSLKKVEECEKDFY